MSGRILLTGATGQVGGELMRALAPLGEIVAPPRTELNLANASSIREMVRTVRPRWIVNPAAYTAVDKAESEPELAYAINAEAVRTIGEEAREYGAGVIHFSTDYVFNGEGATPYLETDATDPTSVYGASKLAGEQTLRELGGGYMIFRTSWVYGTTGKNFLRTILNAAREQERLRVVADQYGAPTWSRDLARMTAWVMKRVEERAAGRELDDALGAFRGIYHASGAGETTWFGFATEAVATLRNREPGTKLAMIDAITTAEYATPTKRPANSRLNCEKLATIFDWTMMNWRDSLSEVMAEL